MPRLKRGPKPPPKPLARGVCRSLLDAIGDKRECDAAVEYAQHIPVRAIAHMLGLPEEDGDFYRTWIHQTPIEGVRNPAVAIAAMHEQNADFKKHVELRRAKPGGDDLVSFLLKAEVEGKPLCEPHILGSPRLILIAAIDTT